MSDIMVKAQAAIDKKTGGGHAQTVLDMLDAQRPAIARALPKHMNADRLLKVAWGCISRTPALLKCSPVSLVRSVVHAAELGLEPSNVLGHCYLVPFGKDATLLVGYRGFIELAARGGLARYRPARVVYDCDEFTWSDGLKQDLSFVPRDRGHDSKPTHAFVVVDFSNGLPPMAEVMTAAEIETIRKRSRGGNSQAWRDHWDEMAKKTVVRRMAKYMPLSPELQRAAAEDESREILAVDAHVVPIDEGGSDEAPNE